MRWPCRAGEVAHYTKYITAMRQFTVPCATLNQTKLKPKLHIFLNGKEKMFSLEEEAGAAELLKVQ